MNESENKDRSLIRDLLFFLFVFLIVAMAIFYLKYDNEGTDRKLVGVHIKGEVNAPGYYELDYGSRVKDLLNLSGMETDEADLTEINLARKLSDGEEIIIPKKGENSEKESPLININTADLYKLCKLEGIGEKLASNIINYRLKNGGFKSITELKKVDGIGNSKFNKIKDKISVK